MLLVFGIWRYQTASSPEDNLREFRDINDSITLIGKVSKEPDVRENQIKLEVEATDFDDRQNLSPQGISKVLVTVGRYPEYRYGDTLEITGKLKTPKEFEDFNYKEYLAKDGIYSVIYYPEVKFIKNLDSGPLRLDFYYSEILVLKNKLRESIYNVLSPPQSSLLGAMILGDKSRISQEWKEKLNRVGIRHITAISGMHITILVGILMWGLVYIGMKRAKAFYLALLFLIFYILMIGAPSSAVRAGVMGGLLLLALKEGRLSQSWRVIIFAATVMLAISPKLLRFDVGFQLSFFAVIGIVFLSPYFMEKLKFIPKWLDSIKGVIVMTLAAQIFTLPILIYNFGQISLVAPIANFLIVPILPYILVFGFLTGFIGMAYQYFGIIFSFPAWLLLAYIVKLVNLFSGLKISAVTLNNVHWAWLILSYLILGLAVWRIKRREKTKEPLYFR